MTNRSIKVGGDAVGNQMNTGDHVNMEARIDATLEQSSSNDAVNILRELQSIKAILQETVNANGGKVGRALDDAIEEAQKKSPDRNEIGSALSRALDYAKKGAAAISDFEKIIPHLRNAAGWLGHNWPIVLARLGLGL